MATPALWTDDEADQARRMWDAGKSAALISKAIGKSRNAVIGFAHRNGFPARGTSSRISPKSGKAISSLPRRKARATMNAKSVGTGHKSISCSPRTKAGAAPSSPLQPTAPAPFKPRWPEPFLTATGCQWPLQSGPIDPGQHLHMLVCNDPFEAGSRHRRYCQFHAEHQHVKQNGEALEYA